MFFLFSSLQLLLGVQSQYSLKRQTMLAEYLRHGDLSKAVALLKVGSPVFQRMFFEKKKGVGLMALSKLIDLFFFSAGG